MQAPDFTRSDHQGYVISSVNQQLGRLPVRVVSSICYPLPLANFSIAVLI